LKRGLIDLYGPASVPVPGILHGSDGARTRCRA